MPTKLPDIALVKREPVADEIARKLLAYLLSGDVRPGERLPAERRLAESLGVGRSSVREAMKALGFLGLVEVRQGDGTYLTKNPRSLLPDAVEWGLLLAEPHTLDLVEARRYIELALVELAAARRDADQLERLRGHLEAMASPSISSDEFVEADIRFHLAIAEMAGNTALQNMLTSVQSLLRVWIRRVIVAAGESKSSYAEHVPIYEAIANSDAAAAREAMLFHMSHASERLQQTLLQHQPAS